MSDSSSSQLKLLIEQYLNEAKMMQLATVTGNKPWVCNVWFAVDKELNIYWFSATNRRHSEEVAKNPHVAAAICLPAAPSDQFARGLQLEGTAELLTKPGDIATAMKYYVGRVFSLKQVKQFMSLASRPHRFYRITPSSFVLFDTLHFPENSRQMLEMKSRD